MRRIGHACWTARWAVVLGFLRWVSVGRLCADIISNSGNIYFDAGADNTREMTLNGSKLGIGTTVPSTNLEVQGNTYISNNLGIGTANPSSTLEVSGSVGFSIQSVSSNTTLSGNTCLLADTSSANLTLTLPYSGNVAGRQYSIKKITNSGNLVVMATNGYLDNTYNKLPLTSSGNNFPYLSVLSTNSTWSIMTVSGVDNSLPTTLSDNLIGWWKLDSSSGNTATDSSGQNQQGILYDFATSGWYPADGKVQGMLACDGAAYPNNDYVDIGNSSIYSFGLSNWTVAFWVRKNAASGNYTNWRGVTKWVTNGNPELGEWAFSLATTSASGNGNQPMLNTYIGAASQKAEATNSLTIGTWAHIAGKRDGGSIILYLNGQQEAVTSGIIGAMPNNLRNIRIGWVDTVEGTMAKADFDDLRIYNRALTAAEILALYNQGQ